MGYIIAGVLALGGVVGAAGFLIRLRIAAAFAGEA